LTLNDSKNNNKYTIASPSPSILPGRTRRAGLGKDVAAGMIN
jgi:hypothetical protein